MTTKNQSARAGDGKTLGIPYTRSAFKNGSPWVTFNIRAEYADAAAIALAAAAPTASEQSLPVKNYGPEYLDDLRAEAAVAPAAAPAWQPIETAPMDGRDLLLWERDSSVPFVGAWRNGRRPGWHCDTEHYDTDGNACVISNLWQEGVTHWMPLPAAPGIQAPATVSGSQP